MGTMLKIRYLALSLSLLCFNAHSVSAQETETPAQEEQQLTDDPDQPKDEGVKPEEQPKAEETKAKEAKPEETKKEEKAPEKEKEEINPEDLILKSKGEWKEKEASIYRMPSSATRGIKGEGVTYYLWIDDQNWKETPKLNANAEKSLKSTNEDALAIVTIEKRQYALDQLDDIVIKNAKASGFDKASIVKEEKRIVNGTELLFIHWKASIKGEEVDFLSYLYSGKEGTVMVHTYTASNLLEKNRKIMENLLNGLTFDHVSKEK